MTDLFLPLGMPVIEVGQTVLAGETVLATSPR